MKTIFTLLAITISISLFAQRVAILNGSSGAQAFDSPTPFEDAYNAAVDGDTIYLPGGNMSVPSPFEKSLLIYGAGYHPDSTQATMKTAVSGNISIREDASNSHFEGIEFLNNVGTPTNEPITNVVFKRCKFNGLLSYNGSALTASNNSFMECIFLNYISIQNSSNTSFHNNIFESDIRYAKGAFFTNNIFLMNTSASSSLFRNCDYNAIQNNVFVSNHGNIISTAPSNYCTGNMVYNNLFVAENPNYGGNPIFGSNYTDVNQGDIFINQSGHSHNFQHDYNLQDPSTYLGNDNDEVGIYGGIFPFKAGGIPLNPHIQQKNIANQTNNNGELEIEIQVEAQNY